MAQGSMLRLAGLAGIGVGLFILPFAVSDAIVGGLFAPEVLRGATGEAWLQRITAHPDLARVAITLPAVGFALMLVVGLALYRLGADTHWAGTLGLAGYVVGVPLAVETFVSTTSLVWSTIGSDLATMPDHAAQLLPSVTSELHRFMVVNFAAGPLFVIVVGHSSMALAAWRASVLPRWLCVWALVNGAILLVGMASVWWPALTFLQIGGPLSMLWMMTTGAVLLRKSFLQA